MSVAELHIVDRKRTCSTLGYDVKLYIDGVEQKTAVEVSDCFSPGWRTVRYVDGTVNDVYVEKTSVLDKRKKPLFKKIRKNKKGGVRGVYGYLF